MFHLPTWRRRGLWAVLQFWLHRGQLSCQLKNKNLFIYIWQSLTPKSLQPANVWLKWFKSTHKIINNNKMIWFIDRKEISFHLFSLWMNGFRQTFAGCSVSLWGFAALLCCSLWIVDQSDHKKTSLWETVMRIFNVFSTKCSTYSHCEYQL